MFDVIASNIRLQCGMNSVSLARRINSIG